MKKPAICTIVSKNYLPFARTLAESFHKYNDGQIFVLLVDKIESYFKPEDDNFTLITIDDIKEYIPDFHGFCFKYNILELNTATKPFLLEYLLNKYDLEKIVYLDPDILVTNSLVSIFSILDDHSIVLTPHTTEPITDDLHPSENTFLKSGAYNLGFGAFSKNSIKHIKWWQNHLKDHCLVDFDRGLFVDQKWMDLIPGFCEDVFILREPGYNVAYWNYHCREVSLKNNEYLVNGEPSYFFHFSGFNPENIEPISKHQNRYSLFQRPDLRPIFEYYRDLILKNGWHAAKSWPYAFGSYDNGEKIGQTDRRIYLDLGEGQQRFGNPFQAKGEDSFYSWVKKKKLLYLLSNSYIFKGNLAAKASKQLSKFPSVHGIVQKVHSNYKNLKKYTNLRVYESQKKHDTGPTIGINISGYITSESGTGEACRANIRAAERANIPFLLNNISTTSRQKDSSYNEFSDENKYLFNLIHVNADQSKSFFESKKRYFFKDKYNIGFWYWELSEFPAQWIDRFKYYDEIWVASSFCQDAISKTSSIPVTKIPPSVRANFDPGLDRKYFNIPDDHFVFLFVFDFLSFIERKNPFSVINSFCKSFSPSDKATLIIKCINSEKNIEQRDLMVSSASGHNIVFYDQYLSKEQLNALIRFSDCYVSMHRSEGFGLPLAEAMYLGKPVIATGYSGNLEFMDINNSYLVKYDLVEIEQDYGPYKKGNVWANPDVVHASELMRHVYENPSLAIETGKRASQDINNYLGPDCSGVKIRNRLDAILRFYSK